jgi:hypothetical protein
VSKIKSAAEKKRLSLERDRRNVYGENSKASRKGIRRGKQRSHMEERRSAGKILRKLREDADKLNAIEADDLTKTSVIRSRQKAFKKTPDRPLGEMVKQKLESRAAVQSGIANTFPVWPNMHSAEIFDRPYVRAIHKRAIMIQIRYHVNPKRSGSHTKRSRRDYDRQEAERWRQAILRDAPPLQEFFAEEPQWRDRMLNWCERTLISTSGS